MSSTTEAEAPRANLKLLNWSAVLFAFLQSVCSAFLALSGIRLFIGATAFASALGVVKLEMHIAAIRIPMMLIALVGSLLNLLVLWQVWRLRGRSASAWRQKPVSAQKRRSEILQLLCRWSRCSYWAQNIGPTGNFLAAIKQPGTPLFPYFFFFNSSSNLSCNLSLYPTGNSNVLPSAVNTNIFRVESRTAEQISQCSRCFSISSRSLASTV